MATLIRAAKRIAQWLAVGFACLFLFGLLMAGVRHDAIPPEPDYANTYPDNGQAEWEAEQYEIAVRRGAEAKRINDLESRVAALERGR